MSEPNFKPGDTVTATVDFSGSPEGPYKVTGTVYYIDAHPGCLWLGKDLIVQHNEVPSWITVRIVKRAVAVA